MPRRSSEVVVIYWRDIPAQVNGQVGRDRHQVALSDKFQRAIDRAKRKAKINTAHEDVAQWRRVSQSVDGDVEAAARAEADRVTGEATRQAEKDRNEAQSAVERVNREAQEGARATREQAESEASNHVAGVQQATADMRQRADTVGNDLNGLVEELRTTIEQVLASVRSSAGSLET
ncbi:MAG: virulence factor, partial [Ilumatobacteraceae bacterium]